MSTPDHVSTLFEGLAKNVDGSLAQAPLLDMAFHKDPSLARAIGAHDYYRGNVLRVLSMAELMTVAASYILRQGDYVVANTELEGFSALHRALANAQNKLATSLSMAGLSLLDLKENETLHISRTAAASLHSTFQNALKGRAHLNKLTDLLTAWAASIQSSIEDATTSDVDKALKIYFDEIVTAISVLRALTKSAPDAVVAQPTQANQISVTQTVTDASEDSLVESAEAIDLSKGIDTASAAKVPHMDGQPDTMAVSVVTAIASDELGSMASTKATAVDFQINFTDDSSRSISSVYGDWAKAIQASGELAMTEAANGAISMKTPQGDVDEAVHWLLANESGMIWGSALLTYFGMLDYAAEQLARGEGHNFKENVSSKLLRGLAGKMEKTSRDIEYILLNYTKDPLTDLGLWDKTPAGAKLSAPSSKLNDIIVDIDFEDALDNLMDALAEEGGSEFIGCFSKVVLALANARDEIRTGRLLADLSDDQRDQMSELLKGLSLSVGRALDGLAVQFRSARLHDKGLAAS